jgi:hypothetical protein
VYNTVSDDPVTEAMVTAYQARIGQWPAEAFGQTNPQTTDNRGEYGFAPPNGRYTLAIQHDGYQPYRSLPLWVDEAPLAEPIGLTPLLSQTPVAEVSIDDRGFTPAHVQIQPGEVVSFTNLDGAGHAVQGETLDSGWLMTGESYAAHFTERGFFILRDAANPERVVIVEVGYPHMISMPIVLR